MTVLPGAIRQIGYVVDDLDAALAGWVNIGVGPWFVMRDLVVQGVYRGEPCEVTLTLALANSGEMQLELIQQQDDTPSIYTEFISSGHEGYQQLAYWTTDFDATMEAVRDAGWPVVWSGGGDHGVRFVYMQPPGGPAEVIEVSEYNEVTSGMAAFVRDAAVNWDGSDPIRVLGA
jgi:catechol 2,3-dioxygenase-like lactoylglutathione lyase family enzyme